MKWHFLVNLNYKFTYFVHIAKYNKIFFSKKLLDFNFKKLNNFITLKNI